jgi:hypothetical protein
MSEYPVLTEQINTILQTPAPAGHIFSGSIIPIDQKREVVVQKLQNDHENQTTVMTINKQVDNIASFLKQTLNVSTSTASQNDKTISKLQTSISGSKTDLDKITMTTPIVQNLLVLLTIVVVVYLVGSFLGSLVHIIAFLVLVIGFWYIISTSPSNGQSNVSSFFSSIGSAFGSTSSTSSSM